MQTYIRYSVVNRYVLSKIESIVREDGRNIRLAHDVTITMKETKDNLVTSADIMSEKFLKEKLTELIPGSAFVGEEGDDAKILKKGYTWIVDPIDGTANFARGIPMCAVSVALFKDGEPYIGVVYDPFTETLFKAESGKGAFCNNVRMHVSDRPIENSMLCTAWCTYHKENAPVCFRVSQRMHPVCEDIRRLGTAAYELSMLANGSVDLYYEYNLSPWDHAAALVCVKEAGGVFSGVYGNVNYDGPGPVIAANNQKNLEYLRDIVVEEMEKESGKE